MVDTVLLAVGVLGVLVAALSGRLRRLPVSAAMLGLLAGVALGPAVTGVLDLPTVLQLHPLVHEAARTLLAVSVMGVALRYPFSSLRRRLRPVALLVLVAMPAMALLTAGVSLAVLGVGLGAALLLGTAMAATDPVLATSAVTGRPAEEHLPDHERQVLSGESGANDGLALPLVLVALALSGASGAPSLPSALGEAFWQVVGGAGIGAALGWLTARVLRLGREHGAAESGPLLLLTILLALGVLGAAGLARTDGVLAVFVAGLVFNASSTGSDRSRDVPVDEAADRFLLLPMFLLIGATLPWQAWGELGWRAPAFAVGVLLLRRLPVLVVLHRLLGLRLPGGVYLGWFGPVGVSALFYLTLEAARLGVDETVLAAGVLVVVASTLAHGLTVPVGLTWYRRASRQQA